MSQDDPISFEYIQQHYEGKVVALDKAETQVLAVAANFEKVLKLLQQEGIQPEDCVYVGPVPKPGTVSI